MNIRDILRQWLQSNGYEGLYEPGECCCEINDLCPCSAPDIPIGCQPGVKMPCPGPSECNCDGDCDFHIGSKPFYSAPETEETTDANK